MSHSLIQRFAAWAVLALVLMSEAVSACPMCYGDPDSPMVKGVAAGVWVLVGVVGFVLAGVAGTSLFWIHRSRAISRTSPNELTN